VYPTTNRGGGEEMDLEPVRVDEEPAARVDARSSGSGRRVAGNENQLKLPRPKKGENSGRAMWRSKARSTSVEGR
jgi:hypothetical protein